MPAMERLPHHAQMVTLRGKSCRVGARVLGAPAAASETRAGLLIAAKIVAHLPANVNGIGSFRPDRAHLGVRGTITTPLLRGRGAYRGRRPRATRLRTAYPRPVLSG